MTSFTFTPTVTAGATAPVLSSPTDTANGSSAATGTVSTTVGSGTLYAAVTTSASPPSIANIKAGTGAVWFGNQAVSGTGVQTLSPAPSGLAASTTYYIHYVHELAGGEQSNVASGDGFTTSASGSYSTTNATSISQTITLPGTGASGLSTSMTVTWNFSTTVKVGWFTDLNGDNLEPFVVSDTPFSITSITPASTTDGNSLQIHGAMIDPLLGGSQGFDENMQLTAAGGTESSPFTYSDAVNDDPAVGGAISVGTGDNKTVVKAYSIGDDYAPVGNYFCLHIVSAIPGEDKLPPAISELGSTNTPKTYPTKPANLNCFRSLTLTGIGTAADKIAGMPPRLANFFGANGADNSDPATRLLTDRHWNSAAASFNYSASRSDWYFDFRLHAHSSASTTAQKNSIATRMLMEGYQSKAIYDRGAKTDFGAGQGAGIGGWLYDAAFLEGSSSLLTAAQALPTQGTDPAWVVTSDLSQSISGNNGWYAEAYRENMVGLPWAATDEAEANYSSRYNNMHRKIIAYEHLPTMALQNGPGSIDGADAIINGSFATSNASAAIVAFVDCIRDFKPQDGGSYLIGSKWDNAYDTIRALNNVAPLTSFKPWPPFPDTITVTTGSGAGEIDWTLDSALDFGNGSAITGRNVSVSIDGFQWTSGASVGTNLSGTVSSLLTDIDYFVRFNQTNANGTSDWSVNHRKTYSSLLGDILGSPRNTANAGGTGSATAPSYAGGTAPALLEQLNPNWIQEYNNWQPAASIGLNTRTLRAGMGFPSAGFPIDRTTGLSWQWQVNGSNLSGETAQDLDPSQNVSIAMGDSIDCDVTLTNATSSATAATNALTVPNYVGRRIPQSSYVIASAATSGTATAALGPAFANRWVVIVLYGRESATFPNSVDLNGTATFTKVAETLNAPSFVSVWVSDAKFASGTSATLNWSAAGPVATLGYEVIVLNKASSAVTPFDTATGTTDLDEDVVLSLNTAADGFYLVAAQNESSTGGAGVSITPAPLFIDESRDVNSADVFRLVGEHSQAETGKTITLNPIQNPNGFSALAVSWEAG